MNDIEYMLMEDNRSKKKTGSGVFSRASRRGYTGTVRTQVDFLKGKSKKEYMKNGECVTVGNIYDDIKNVPSLEELRKMDKNTATSIMMILRDKHMGTKLCAQWGITTNYLYRHVLPEFNLPTKSYMTKTEIKSFESPKTVIAVAPENKRQETGFELSFFKEGATGESLQDKLTNYISILEKEGIYDIKLSIKEIF